MSRKKTSNNSSGKPTDNSTGRKGQPARLGPSALNVPNVLTSSRILLSIIMFAFMTFEFYWISFWLFIVAASTDWLDGYYARKYGQVTKLGRILDPFADKVIVCGAFIFLASAPALLELPWGLGAWGLRAWMVVLIVARELLVTALRSFIEQQGGDFSAKRAGKWKMVLQCVAAGACLFYLSYDNPAEEAAWWCVGIMLTSLWLAIVLTVYSGLEYIFVAVRMVRQS